MKRFLHRSVLVLGLLQATSLFAISARPAILQYFEVVRIGGGSVHAHFVLSEEAKPEMKVMRCGFRDVKQSFEIANAELQMLVHSILQGDYTIASDRSPSRSMTGTWLSAGYSQGTVKVEVKRPLLIKDGKVTNAMGVLETAIHKQCKILFSGDN